MTTPMEILCGPAGSGKTARLLDVFRAELVRLAGRAMPGEAVWITPTARSRRQILRELLAGPLRGCFAPNVLTFEAFAERVLRTTGHEITPLSGTARRMLAASVIEELRQAEALAYFAPIAATSGFLDLFLGFITDLKRDETWPDEFEKACRQRGSLPKDIELAALYRRYQDRLNSLGLYDAEGRFWTARFALERGKRGVFERLSLVIVDGFTDFTYPQYEILKHLSAYADRMLITLPMDDASDRGDLFAKPIVALERLRNLHTEKVSTPKTLVLRSDTKPKMDLAQIAAHLFGNPRTTPQLAQAPRIEIIEAAGPSGEARAIAERIKRLLIEGIAGDQIVVAVRNLDDSADSLSEAFAAAGIPFGCARQTRLAETPIAKTLFLLVQSELDDWAFERLAALLRSNYFHPNWPSAAEPSAISATLQSLRKFKLAGDRRKILTRLSAVAAQPIASSDPIKNADAEHLRVLAESARALLGDLSNATEVLRSSTDFSSWIDRVVSLATDLGIAPRVAGKSELPLELRDRVHWRHLTDILYEAARTSSVLKDDRRLSLSEFARRLKDILASQTIASGESEAGKVLILDASDVRNLEIPYLFVAALSEASFPQARRDDCFFTEAERRQFVRKGSATAASSSNQQDEMLLFYSIVTRARERLTLSYPNVSPSVQPLFASPYVVALRELFTPEALRVSTQSGLDPLVPRERVLSTADLRLLATEDVRAKRADLFCAMADRIELARAARQIVASAEMAAARFEQRGLTVFEGMLQSSTSRRVLAERFPRDYQFSTTQLEEYAGCPFRFLMSSVFRIDPLDSPESAIDARRRGQVLHDILAGLHAPGSANSGRSADRDAFAASIRALIDRHLPSGEFDDRFEQALLAAERHFATTFADIYAAQLQHYRDAHGEHWDAPPEPAFVELAFGDVPGGQSTKDGQAPSFVTFGKGEAEVRVRGRIDRIDVGTSQGRTVFNVIDYKTRSSPQFRLEDLRAGLALQLAIYVSAVRQSGILGANAQPHQMAYWNLTKSGCVPGLKGTGSKKLESLEPDLIAEIERTLHHVLPQLVHRMREGQFPVYSADPDCTGYCPYHTVCRVKQVRSVENERQKLWSLSGE